MLVIRWLLVALSPRVFSLVAASALTVLFVAKTGLITGWGEWYSGDLGFRLQTDAFFRGELGLSHTPAGHGHDWSWHEGSMQQVWGLGIPLLRFPFELVARIFGVEFPDRIFVVLLYFTCLYQLLCHCPLLSAVPELGVRGRLRAVAVRLSFALPLLLAPAFQNLAGAVFSVYEEGVYCALLWTLLCFIVTMRAARERESARLLFLAAAMAGFSILIRPTSLAPACAGLALLAWLRRGITVRSWMIAGALFLVGPLIFVVTNKIRFGGFGEVGHVQSLISIPSYVYDTRFGSLYAQAPSWEQALDMFGALFFAHNVEPWRGSYWREHFIYFGNFSTWTLAVYLASVIGIGALVLLRRRLAVPLLEGTVDLRRALLTSLWGVAVFAVFFVFYMRFPAIASRYLTEFLIPLFAPVGAFCAVLLDMKPKAAGSRPRRWAMPFFQILLLAGVVGWTVFFPIDQLRVWEGPHLADYAKNFYHRWPKPEADLPAEYRCGETANLRAKIMYNAIAWNYNGDCSVTTATQLFFFAPECIFLRVEPLRSTTPEDLESFEAAVGKIRMRVGLEEWVRADQRSEGLMRELTFCPAEEARDPEALRPDPKRVELAVIGWVTTREVVTAPVPNLRLLLAKPVARVGPR